MASIPFGCRYRLIDFHLSNMVNADITKVGIITHYNYQSLIDHLSTGKDWDLARRKGGITILSPYLLSGGSGFGHLYNTRLEALMSIDHYINKCEEEYVVLSDCDIVCNVDVKDMIKQHKATNADITIATKRVTLTPEKSDKHSIIESTEDGRITGLKYFNPYTSYSGEHDINMNIWVMKTKLLAKMISTAHSRGFKSFSRDLIAPALDVLNIRKYDYQSFYASINSLSDYYDNNMALLKKNNRLALFDVENRPIYTKIRNSTPTYYSSSSIVNNSLIADGCRIYGTVENSIIFRGVYVAKNAVIKNSILLQDTCVFTGSTLNCVITDKNVVIKEARNLSGHPTKPFYIEKNAII
jgi:glucose-1-phosphate adenylyltransferase